MTGPDAERVAMVALARACAAHGISDAELTAALYRAGSARAVLAGAGSAFAGDGRLRAAACHAFPGERLAERLAAWTEPACACRPSSTSAIRRACAPSWTDRRCFGIAARVAPGARGFAIVGTRSPSPEGRAEPGRSPPRGAGRLHGGLRARARHRHRGPPRRARRRRPDRRRPRARPRPSDLPARERRARRGDRRARRALSQWDPEEPAHRRASAPATRSSPPWARARS